jgi:hypothetical protein
MSKNEPVLSEFFNHGLTLIHTDFVWPQRREGTKDASKRTSGNQGNRKKNIRKAGYQENSILDTAPPTVGKPSIRSGG